MKTGVLLVNLGTPASTEVADVRRYLAEFLSDPRVLDINPLGRWLLLHLIILRTRPRRSAEAYRKVWMPEGSPLMVYSERLTQEVARRLPGVEVRLAMRYGQPSIRRGLEELAALPVDRVVVAPLYPQYASSTTGTVLEEVYRQAAAVWNVPSVQVVPPFYDDPGFLGAWEAIARRHFDDFKPDHVLFSYHGLPVRHVQKSDPTGRHCADAPDCCQTLCAANRHCYAAQCYATTRALRERLGLDPAQTSTTFQSRLGRDPWLQPYTDETIERLAKEGVKRLAVLCPAFVADCLETLEEIGMEARESFIHAGGQDMLMVPSLNAEPVWASALADLIAPMCDPDARAMFPV